MDLCTHHLPGEQEKALQKVRVVGNSQAGSLQVPCWLYSIILVKQRSVHKHTAFERGKEIIINALFLLFYSEEVFLKLLLKLTFLFRHAKFKGFGFFMLPLPA